MSRELVCPWRVEACMMVTMPTEDMERAADKIIENMNCIREKCAMWGCTNHELAREAAITGRLKDIPESSFIGCRRRG